MSKRPQLTDEQQRALDESQGSPVYLVDRKGEDVVILRADSFKRLIEGSLHISDTYTAQQKALAPVWNDSELDAYTDQDGSPIQ